MRKVYSCQNAIELGPFKFALDAKGIKYLIKNEFAQGAIGEIPATESWPQIWVVNDSDRDSALKICQRVELAQRSEAHDWSCRHCDEINASSFEYCWQCQALKPE